LFKNKEGEKDILSLYEEKLSSLNIEYTEKQTHTTFGKTNVIISGDTNKPPILIIHGSNGCAPIALETYAGIEKHYCVYAVDVLAQPNKSAESRLSMKTNDYGKWIHEIINSLNLKEVTLTGFSFGGLIILKTLEYKEEHIKEVFLTAPAYIVNGNPFKALFKVFIPMKRYMRTKRIVFVEQFLSQLFTEKDGFALAFLSKVFLHFDMDFTPVPVIKSKNALKIKTPITLFAAADDLMFPGQKMIKRAKKIFPSLKKAMLLENSKHVQSTVDNKRIVDLITNS
jgi:pimeloyl-ACP methyl ester carboxylesterase